MNKEISVIIPLDEYNNLIETKEQFLKAFEEKDATIFRDVHFGIFGTTSTFKVITNNAFSRELLNSMKKYQEEIQELRKENAQLKEKSLNNKKFKWF